MNTQVIVMLGSFVVFGIVGFAMSRSIKRYEEQKSKTKKKKGRSKYMPESKKPGR